MMRTRASAVDHDLRGCIQRLVLLRWLLARTVEGDRAKSLVARLGNAIAELLANVERGLEQSRDARALLAWREAAASRITSLTPRQREIMERVLAGHPSKNIAADLGISQRTVESHRAAIMKRTGSKSLPALARLAFAAATALPILPLPMPPWSDATESAEDPEQHENDHDQAQSTAESGAAIAAVSVVAAAATEQQNQHYDDQDRGHYASH
jgi:DNA-binding CsgD family transcriptional regulator